MHELFINAGYQCSLDINATYFPVSDFIMTVAFSVKPYKLR